MPGLTILSLLFGVAATAAGVMAVDRMHVMLTLTSSASASDIMLPVGHWLMVGAWMAVVAMMIRTERRDALYRCLGVGIALHVLILVTLFVDKLSDREAFSATIYLMYARLFCMTALVLAMAWVPGWLQRMRTGANPITALEAPLAIGAAALAVALVRQSPLMGLVAIGGGVVIAVVIITAPAAIRRLLSTVGATVSNEVVFLAAVCAAALALRLLYVQRIMGDPNYLDAGADGRLYDTLAWSLASGGGIPESFTNRYPLLLLGYVWFLAAIYQVIGHSYLAAVAAQSVIGAATAALVYFAGRLVFGAAAARVAAIFTALSFTLIFAAASLGHQAVDLFLTALVTVMLLQLVANDSALWRWGAAGLVMGGAFAVRETAIFFAAFVAAWIPLAYPRGWRASGPALSAYAAGAAIVVLPFLAPKIVNPDSRQAMRGHFERMYRGEGEPSSTPRPDLISPVADPRAALAQLQESPRYIVGTLARAYAQNFAVQFFTQPYGGFDLVFLRKGTEYYYAMWFYAYAFTVAGTAVALRLASSRGVKASAVVLLLGLIASRTIPHLILVSNYRHRVPIEPFLILLASVGAVSLWERLGVSPVVVAAK